MCHISIDKKEQKDLTNQKHIEREDKTNDNNFNVEWPKKSRLCNKTKPNVIIEEAYKH